MSSFTGFRNKYFHWERNGQRRPNNMISSGMISEMFRTGWKYAISDSNRERLMEKISPIAFFAKTEDCLDLPETIDTFRKIEMSESQKSIYNDMKASAIAEINGTRIPANIALTKLGKLRQICSGFAIDSNGEVQNLDSNPKFEELHSVLEEIGNSQVIIWCNYHQEIKTIRNSLNAVTLYGETKDKDQSIQSFKSGESQYLLAHPASAAHGLTFNNCHYQVFYSLSYSFEQYEQARGRTHRIGQKNSTVYIHLLMKNSIDETIYRVLKRKGKSQEILSEFLK